MALRSDGTGFCWGRDSDGICGATFVGNHEYVPSESVAVHCATHVALGDVGVESTTDGHAAVWGTAIAPEFGDGTFGGSSIGAARQVPNLSNVANVATLANVTVLRGDGSVWWWGERKDTVDPVEVPFPTQAPLPGRAVQIIDSCFLLDTGDVYCMGRNQFGQVGDGTTTARMDPVRVPLAEPATEVAGDFTRRCAILASKKIECWGWWNNAPAYISGVAGFDHIRFGSNSGWCVFNTAGPAACYDEVAKQLTPFAAFDKVLDMALASYCVLTADHQIYCVGPSPNPNDTYKRIPDPREWQP